jgi:hypothetical protein
MCDSYSQFDDGVGRTDKARAGSNEDMSIIHTLLLSTGVSGAGPMLAIISKILDRSVAGWGQLSAFDAVRIKTFLREQGSVL